MLTQPHASLTDLHDPDVATLSHSLAAAAAALVIAPDLSVLYPSAGLNSAAHPTACLRLRQAPSMPLPAYIERLMTYMQCSPECYVAMYIFLRRVAATGIIPLDHFTIHRVVGTLLVLSVKSHDDRGIRTMPYYAAVLGVTTSELLAMERCLLLAMNFHLFVGTEEYAGALAQLLGGPHRPTAAPVLVATDVVDPSRTAQMQSRC